MVEFDRTLPFFEKKKKSFSCSLSFPHGVQTLRHSNVERFRVFFFPIQVHTHAYTH